MIWKFLSTKKAYLLVGLSIYYASNWNASQVSLKTGIPIFLKPKWAKFLRKADESAAIIVRPPLPPCHRLMLTTNPAMHSPAQQSSSTIKTTFCWGDATLLSRWKASSTVSQPTPSWLIITMQFLPSHSIAHSILFPNEPIIISSFLDTFVECANIIYP